MLESLEINNFKSLKKIKINFSNLTLISGLNGMGKSSVIQVLLLLRDAYDQKILSHEGLLLNNKFVNIGIGKDALSIDAEDESFSFFLTWENKRYLNLKFGYKNTSNLQPLIKMEPKQFDFLDTFFINDFQYLSAERLSPKSSFPVSDYDISNLHSLGKNGEYTIHYLFVNGSSLLQNSALNNPKARSGTLLANVDAWMSEITPGIKITANLIPEINQASLQYEFETSKGYTEKFRPENVGFGLSYVLPVVTAVLAAKSGDLLIVENPEAHLHPAGQSAIAKLMALAAQSGIQIIAETHSDHFLNGIRIGVKQNMIKNENVALYYFSREEHSTEHTIKVTQPFIDKNGKLDEWPKGFFDEWDKNLDKLIG
jgi:predicted ATPase